MVGVDEVRKSGGVTDFVAEGFHHANPDRIAGWVLGNNSNFTNKERESLTSREFGGLGGLTHSFSGDEKGLDYHCHTKDTKSVEESAKQYANTVAKDAERNK